MAVRAHFVYDKNRPNTNSFLIFYAVFKIFDDFALVLDTTFKLLKKDMNSVALSYSMSTVKSKGSEKTLTYLPN